MKYLAELNECTEGMFALCIALSCIWYGIVAISVKASGDAVLPPNHDDSMAKCNGPNGISYTSYQCE